MTNSETVSADISEAVLRSAALAVSGAEREAVFRELVRYLVAILGVDGAFIATPDDRDACRLTMLAFHLDGELRERFGYRLSGTPCETVLGQQFRLYPAQLPQLFPLDPDFAQLGIESYAGHPLTASDGRALGLIAAIARKPFANPDLVESVLKIFAVRAVAELERQRNYEALRSAAASYQAIFDASEDAIFLHDWDTGAIVDANPRACEAYGYSREQMRQVRLRDISSGIAPYTEEEGLRLIHQAKEQGVVRFEWQRRNRDGSLHWDEVCLKKAEIDGRPGILAFTREITERKLAEERRAQLEAQLRQAQKMEAIGQLTGGIAHDFNNLLTTILGYVVLTGERLGEQAQPKLLEYLGEAQHSCERARDLIEQMLTFSRGTRGQPRALALAPLVEQTSKLLRSTLPATVELQTGLDPGVPAVLADPVQVEQILLNLCINARDAVHGFGTVCLSLRSGRVEGVCASCRQSVAGEYVELCVADNGSGITPETLERMFEPFFTTKEVGKGSGMGLAIVHGILHEHGGHVLVNTDIGRGTAFRVLLPPLEATGPEFDAHQKIGAHAAQRRPLHGRVLVVEDEISVGRYVGELLSGWGLQTTVVNAAGQALRMFVAAPSDFDVIISDQTMPGMTGLELTRALLALRPDIPVLIYTGFSDDLTPERVQAAGARALLRKPVEVDAFYALLQSLLPQVKDLR